METGKQAVILNLFLKNEEIMNHLKDAEKGDWAKIILKEYVGHTPTQVVGGIVVGLVAGYFTCRFL
jgi:acid phosphatase family membrane protein YuiD